MGINTRCRELNPAAIQVTEEVAVTCYWITFKWLEKDGNGSDEYHPYHACMGQERKRLEDHRWHVHGRARHFAERDIAMRRPNQALQTTAEEVESANAKGKWNELPLALP